MAVVESRAGYDQDFDAEVKTSERTRNHLRNLAIINGVIILAGLVVGTLAYLRISSLPELDGQSVTMSRVDAELMLFKGYSVRQVLFDPLANQATCSWFTADACARPLAVRGHGRVYRCNIERGRDGSCNGFYICRPRRC